MLAAEQDQTEQELPKSICEPRHVRMTLSPSLPPARPLRRAASACTPDISPALRHVRKAEIGNLERIECLAYEESSKRKQTSLLAQNEVRSGCPARKSIKAF